MNHNDSTRPGLMNVDYRICLFLFILFRSTMSSVITKHILFGRKLHLFRDDLLNVNGISGNKVRKLAYFMDPSHISNGATVVGSFGGCQSNAMVAISQLVQNLNTQRSQKLQFVYFTKSISPTLVSNPVGNLKNALAAGMQILNVGSEGYKRCETSSAFPVDLLPDTINHSNEATSCLWIPQGAAMPEAKVGVSALMNEMLSYIRGEAQLGNKLPWKICFASGTGTMAYYAAQHLRDTLPSSSPSTCTSLIDSHMDTNIEIVALPCASSASGLMDCMDKLASMSGESRQYPTILSDNFSTKQRRFAQPYKEHLAILYSLFAQTGIDFDMIYAPRAFEILLQNGYLSPTGSSVKEDFNLMYYHCGGVEGNISQMERYKAKNLL